MKMDTFISDISGKKYPLSERVSGKVVRNSIMNIILEEHPDFDHYKYLSSSELNDYYKKYVSDYLKRETQHLSELKDFIEDKSIITNNDNKDIKVTVGQKVADKVASFGGSWTFRNIYNHMDDYKCFRFT